MPRKIKKQENQRSNQPKVENNFTVDYGNFKVLKCFWYISFYLNTYLIHISILFIFFIEIFK